MNRLHVLTLVIKRQEDIPKVRMKSKLLCHICGLNRIATTQVAVSASEMTRWILRMSGTGTVTMSILCCKDNSKNNMQEMPNQSGIELLFRSERFCNAANLNGDSCPADMAALNKTPVIQGVKKVLDEVSITGGTSDTPIEIVAIKWGIQKSWNEIQKQEAFFKKELFRDTEESYMENLRVKHEEVLRLLEQTSLQKHRLDKINAELLQLTQDMEAMAREHATIQMALRIADRIRNPVMVTGGLISTILKKDTTLAASTRQKLEIIQKTIQGLSDFVKNFEELASKEIRSFTQEDLKDIITETLSAWQPVLAKKDIKLAIDMPQEPLKIMANKRVLKTAFLHIFRNAMEATPALGNIQIRLLRQDGKPSVIICDKGSGIPQEIKEKLFIMPISTKPSGTGLGLFLVKEIMEEHQGKLSIESEPGKGTCVTCTFPVRWQEKREGNVKDSLMP